MIRSNVDEGTEPWRTLQSEGRAETIVERSRFLAVARPVLADADAEALVAALKKEHYDARHVVYGLRIGRGAQGLDRSNDDGEPARTGGYPLWQLLDGEGVTDAVIAVVRYFGGVKLGMGGLARAYRDAGRLALEEAGIVERWPEVVRTLAVPYPMLDRVTHLLGPLEEVRVVDTVYAAEPTLHLAVRKQAVDDVRQRLGGLLQRHPEELLTTAPDR